MSESSPTARLEAFCDGVFAIAITLLVIDIRIPHDVVINSNADLWNALKLIAPSIFAFLLSFVIILITWVNHHNSVKLINKSSAALIYGNGFLLLTVAFLPFPTSLLGEYLLTDHAAPAVILYDSVLAAQSLSWLLLSRAALTGGLGKSERAMKDIRTNGHYAIFAIVMYSVFAIVAIWLPLTIALITTLTWVFWLIHGINIKQD